MFGEWTSNIGWYVQWKVTCEAGNYIFEFAANMNYGVVIYIDDQLMTSKNYAQTWNNDDKWNSQGVSRIVVQL
jgi:hypothetical protein